MNASMKVQAQIRQNAEEISSYLTDLGKWEETVAKKDHKLMKTKVSSSSSTSTAATANAQRSTSVRQGAGTVKVSKRADSHTYDKGYKKWEGFDIDSALKEVDHENIEIEASKAINDHATDPVMRQLTPASMIRSFLPSAPQTVAVPRSRGQVNEKDPETSERERGNEEFQRGNFQAAVKSYTRCLGLKAGNFVAFSNRAMTFLKLKEYVRAEADCDCALAIEPKHVKSLVRRATARNALGKHRAALLDLIEAAEIDKNNDQIRADSMKTRELLRNSASRAPMVKIPVRIDADAIEVIPGPDLPNLQSS